MSNLIIGNKYVPISKSIFGPLNSSNIWKKAQKLNQLYLYYVGRNENYLCFSHVKDDALHSDFFLESDVIPYEEEFVLPEEWCIKVTQENRKEIEKWHYFKWSFEGSIYFQAKNNKFYSWHYSNLFSEKHLPELTLEQFKKYILKEIEEFILPERWCIKSTPETFKIIGDFFNTANRTYPITCYSCKGYENNYFYSHNLGNGTSILDPNPASNFCKDYKRSEFTEITLNEFKKHILKSNNMKCTKGSSELYRWIQEFENRIKKITNVAGNNNYFYYWVEDLNKPTSWKYDRDLPENGIEVDFNEFIKQFETNNMKQIGWKFKPNQDQFIKAACAIVSYVPYGIRTINSKVLKFEFDEEYIEKLRDAGVLELWFEPVYEEEIKVGDKFVCMETKSGFNGELNTIYTCIKATSSAILYERNNSICIERCRKATAEEIDLYGSVDIAGYKAEKVKDGIKFGCQTIPTSVLDALEDLMERSAFTTTLKIESTDITLDIIKKLKNL